MNKKGLERLFHRGNEITESIFINISHEFRTPLSLILCHLEDALKLSDSYPVLKDNLTVIRRNSLRLLKLVNTLLDFSRIKAGHTQAQFEKTHLGSLTTELASHFRSPIEKANLLFHINCEFSELVYVDREMWEKIVLNLLSNAFKFTLEGEIEIKLHNIPGNKVELLVRDTGIGIPENELSHIFERFYQVEGSKGRTYEGSGIGLALVKDLVELHGGKIKVSSKLGKGTTFAISLLKNSKHLPKESIIREKSSLSYSHTSELYSIEALRWLPINSLSIVNSPSSSHHRILIVDDNADMCEYLSRLLSEYWHVVTTNNEQTALHYIFQAVQNPETYQPFDLVLSDVIIPTKNGFELLRTLKNNPDTDKIPVILISAHAEEEFRFEGLQAGADDYLIKPFSPKELVTRIRKQLDMCQSRKSLVAKLNIMTRLHGIATQFVQEGNIYNILLEALDTAISITQASKAIIQIIDEKSGNLTMAASKGFSQPFIDYFANSYIGSGACGTALNMGERLIIEDIRKSPMFNRECDLKPFLNEGVLAIQATPLKNRSGKILGILSTHYETPCISKNGDLQMLDLLARLSAEIIESGQLIRERTQWVEMLREADRRKDNFLAMLSHELRNPLTAISNSSFMLSRVPPSSEIALKAQTTIERQLQQMTRLVDDLLDITRITQNKIQLRCEPLDINQQISRTIEDHRPLFENAGISIKMASETTPIMIYADPTRIAQIISNLLQNASKFSLPGGWIQIFLNIEASYVVIRILDNGIGIETDLLERLFEPFMQADSSLDRSQGGLGLGLALVKGLVELHGGKISVKSDGENKGTEFIIKLPFDSSINTVKKMKNKNNVAITSRCVLIIDDNIQAADSLAVVIKMFGHTIHVAYNGPDGIKKAQEIKPDFILCDIGLPEMDGYEVAKILKANENLRSTYLIALSGYAQPADIEKGHTAGFNVYLPKPPDLIKLEHILLGGPSN